MRDLLFFVIFLVATSFGPRMLNMDGDLPRHLLTGRLILTTKSVPKTEPFVYPYFGQTYTAHEWLADVILFILYKYTGLPGIVFLCALLLALTFTFLYSELSFRLDLKIPILFLVVWGAAVTSLNWITRPHIMSMFLLTIWLILTGRLARGEKVQLWIFPVIMIAWCNIHGEFIAGILVLLAYLAGWLWDYFFDRNHANIKIGKNLSLALVFSFLATLVNPVGILPWKTLLIFVNNRYLMSRMAESNPPDFHQPQYFVLLGLLVFSIFLLAVNNKKISTGLAILLAGFSALSLMAARNLHLYGIVAPYVLAEAIGGILTVGAIAKVENIIRNTETRLQGFLWPILISVVLGSVLLLSTTGNIFRFSSTFFPVGALNWLETHPQTGNMFNDLNWGGYLALHLWPEQKTFIDSMADTSGELTRKYEDIVTLKEGWQDLLTNYNIVWAIIPTEAPLAKAFIKAGWQLLYSDSTADIFRKP
jgi:hypothetical protein